MIILDSSLDLFFLILWGYPSGILNVHTGDCRGTLISTLVLLENTLCIYFLLRQKEQMCLYTYITFRKYLPTGGNFQSQQFVGFVPKCAYLSSRITVVHRWRLVFHANRNSILATLLNNCTNEANYVRDCSLLFEFSCHVKQLNLHKLEISSQLCLTELFPNANWSLRSDDAQITVNRVPL